MGGRRRASRTPAASLNWSPSARALVTMMKPDTYLSTLRNASKKEKGYPRAAR